MSQETWSAVDAYLDGLYAPSDPVLEAALADSAAAGLPAISVAPNQGKLLMLLARACGARRILEVGTLGGYSTIWLARGLPADGRLVTLELNPKHAAVARANLARAGLAGRVEVREGPALAGLESLASEGGGPFDLIFIDADKAPYADYFDRAIGLSRRGTLIVADNVVRHGTVLDAKSEDHTARGARRFHERAARDPRVSATTIQTVGVKGHDGFTLAVVN